MVYYVDRLDRNKVYLFLHFQDIGSLLQQAVPVVVQFLTHLEATSATASSPPQPSVNEEEVMDTAQPQQEFINAVVSN